ncbi:hypothetical protein DL93DRAFT_293660 [Clavulina sp. PMI_390]|nr:hypothetical protein DL93DRAFT_293660 [Clavulina sp. PMI_390]
MDLSPFVNADESIGSLRLFLDGLRFDHTPLLLCNPPSGRSNLASIIQDDVNVIENHLVAVEGLIYKLSNLRARLLRERAACAGALTPIGALPTELLGEVFRLATNMSSAAVAAINDVCQSWRSIVSAEPTLWTSLKVRASEGCSPITAYRVHSASLPLHLTVDDARNWPSKLRESFADAETRLGSLCWSSSVNIHNFLSSNIRGQPMTFSALHTLKLIFPQYCAACDTHLSGLDEPPFWEALRYSEFPSLRTLEIAHLSVWIPPEILSRLENINLNFEYMRLERFREILQHARSLKSLAIWGMSPLLEWARPDEDWQETYVLPALQTLKLPLHPTEFVQMLLKTTTCPGLQTLELEGSVWSGSSFRGSSVLPELIRSFVSSSIFFIHTNSVLSIIQLMAALNQLQRTPKLEELTLSKCKVFELGLFTVPLRTHGLQLRSLTFCVSPVETASSFLPHLVETMRARQVAGAYTLELKTNQSMVSLVREALPDVTVTFLDDS